MSPVVEPGPLCQAVAGLTWPWGHCAAFWGCRCVLLCSIRCWGLCSLQLPGSPSQDHWPSSQGPGISTAFSTQEGTIRDVPACPRRLSLPFLPQCAPPYLTTFPVLPTKSDNFALRILNMCAAQLSPAFPATLLVPLSYARISAPRLTEHGAFLCTPPGEHRML